MADKKMIAEILRKEFGITTLTELNSAIEQMKLIDLMPFCGSVNKKSKEATV